VYTGGVDTLAGWLRWRWAQLIGRNPLVRTSDRAEAAALVSALLVCLCAIAVAGAIGTSVHDTRAARYEAMWHDRWPVAATVVSASPVQARSTVTLLKATWHAAGTEHSGTFAAGNPVDRGAHVRVWVNAAGARVAAPTPPWQATVDAAAAALAVWSTIAAALASLFLGLRKWLYHRRLRAWEQSIKKFRTPTA
jgi:hypothetical protein